MTANRDFGKDGINTLFLSLPRSFQQGRFRCSFFFLGRKNREMSEELRPETSWTYELVVRNIHT